MSCIRRDQLGVERMSRLAVVVDQSVEITKVSTSINGLGFFVTAYGVIRSR